MKKMQATLADSRRGQYEKITVGIDFGGNGSGHAFVATGISRPHDKLVALASERHLDEKEKDIDPEMLGKLAVDFTRRVLLQYGRIDEVDCDNAESVLIRGIKKSFSAAGLGQIRIRNARKDYINNRIFALSMLYAQDRFYYVEGQCETLLEALGTAVWDQSKFQKVRLDNGSTDIDSLDAFEYSWERNIKELLPTFKLATKEDE